jgi:hypothetical protein
MPSTQQMPIKEIIIRKYERTLVENAYSWNRARSKNKRISALYSWALRVFNKVSARGETFSTAIHFYSGSFEYQNELLRWAAGMSTHQLTD